MRDPEAVVALAFGLLVAAVVVVFGAWAWRDESDKRGAVTRIDHNEWHCVGATPEDAR